MIEPDAGNGVPSAEQKKKDRRVAYITIWANVIGVTGVMLYIMWFWHPDPNTTWVQWVVRLSWVFFFFVGIDRILAKSLTE